MAKELVYRLIYDATLWKPGCVLIQAMGGTVPKELFFKYFGNSDCWLVAPTKNMKLYRVTESELKQVADATDFTR